MIPPHVLFVLIDDLGFADVGYHGSTASNATILTPAIDAMARVRLENYYVTQLCSPTRTSLLSGRYAYNIGMNGEVIVDGHPSCLPLNASTIADRLQEAGWATAAYGKWDLGMTSWGCTPTCRGFDHFFGFYNAFNDYFTHHVGAGLDLRNDTKAATGLNGSYFTELVTAEHIRWLESVVTANRSQPTFAYLAHEANHAPLQVPPAYIRGGCLKIPASNPSRRMLCGMMTAVDDSVRNVTNVYKKLGIWNQVR
jgi:arylsulfatase B/arylsulfatase I/J